MMVSIQRSFEAVAAYSPEIPTRLPRTEAGILALRFLWEEGSIAEIYPDGTLHSQTDWDAMAAPHAQHLANIYASRDV